MLSLLAVVGLVVSLTAATQAPASITGVISDQAGKPVRGASVQFAALVMDKNGMHTKSVATATTDDTGHYSVAYPPTAAVAELAKLNGGSVNWELDASYVRDGHLYHTTSIFQDPHGVITKTPGVATEAYTKSAWVNPVHNLTPHKLVSTDGKDTAIPNGVVCTTIWVATGRTAVNNGVIGFANAQDDTTVDFRYTVGSTTTLGIAYTADGKVWKQDGEVSLENSSSAYFDSGAQGPNFTNEIWASFTNKEIHLTSNCGTFADRMWVPQDWTGAAWFSGNISEMDADVNYEWAVEQGPGWWNNYPSGSSFNRTSGDTVTTNAGFEVSQVGIGVSSKTDYSTSTSYTWQFGRDPAAVHTLFGFDGILTQASKVASCDRGCRG